jgi:hypothetical protein
MPSRGGGAKLALIGSPIITRQIRKIGQGRDRRKRIEHKQKGKGKKKKSKKKTRINRSH